MKTLLKSLLVFLIVCALQLSLTAQQHHRSGKSAEAAENKTPQKAEDNKSKDPLENIKFRNLGPAVGGGRITAVAGIPGKPNVYYAGAGGGGVWYTQDGGLSWK